MNRKHNSKNPYQGDTKKVLCVCSAGLLRSPTAARVIGETYGYNTRAAGLDYDHALIQVDDILLYWADEVVCMTKAQREVLELMLDNHELDTPITCLGIPDSFAYMDPELVKLIKNKYKG